MAYKVLTWIKMFRNRGWIIVSKASIPCAENIAILPAMFFKKSCTFSPGNSNVYDKDLELK